MQSHLCEYHPIIKWVYQQFALSQAAGQQGAAGDACTLGNICTA
jgi:hypothetical protein